MVVGTLKSLARGDSGTVITTGSFYGSVSSDCRIYSDSARINFETYSAPKAAVIQLSRYFAAHIAEMGVSANTVLPGGIRSTQGLQFTSDYVSRMPMRRMASPRDITGQDLIVGGGPTAW